MSDVLRQLEDMREVLRDQQRSVEAALKEYIQEVRQDPGNCGACHLRGRQQATRSAIELIDHIIAANQPIVGMVNAINERNPMATYGPSIWADGTTHPPSPYSQYIQNIVQRLSDVERLSEELRTVARIHKQPCTTCGTFFYSHELGHGANCAKCIELATRNNDIARETGLDDMRH